VCPLGGPLHLLTFHEPLAHDLINRGFHKGGTEGVPLTIPFPKVGDELLVVATGGVKLGDGTIACRSSREMTTLPPWTSRSLARWRKHGPRSPTKKKASRLCGCVVLNSRAERHCRNKGTVTFMEHSLS
jgi:hypothetical protein